MRTSTLLGIFGGNLVIAGLFTGCGAPTTPAPQPPAAPTEHAHAHGSKGPHGGDLIELGKEEFHAELIHDDAAGTVTIYLLDSAAKATVAIEATDLAINLKRDGKAQQHHLAASPDPGDPDGKASRFVSSSKELGEDLEREGADAQLAVTINGKPYRGKIEHRHQ